MREFFEKHILDQGSRAGNKELLDEEKRRLKIEQRRQELKEAIVEMERPLRALLEQLRPNIEAGRYDSLLGDDVSARFPTRVLRGVVNRAYERQGKAPL